MLDIHDGFHILRRQGLKIQLIRNIKVCADRLRVVVDDNGLIACSGECPCSMHRAKIELDSLPDPDRTGTQYQHFFASGGFLCLTLPAVHGIIVRRRCRKLRRAGVHHLVYCLDAVCIAQFLNLLLCFAGQSSNHIVRELHAFCFLQKFRRQGLTLQCLLHLHQNRNFINKPQVDLSDLMNLFLRNSLADCLRNHPDSLVIHYFQSVRQLLRRKR